jgi:hypothetical protein
VTLRAAMSTETFDLLCRALALFRRERGVVTALRPELDTRAITARLCISPHTVDAGLRERRFEVILVSYREPRHCREHLERLRESNVDGESIQRDLIADLQRVIAFN